jgi:hypothetical protein
MSFVANSFKDACEFLVCYLIQQAYGMAANSVRPADQKAPTGGDGDEFATVRIMTSDSDFGSSFRTYQNEVYPAWDSTVAYVAWAKVTRNGNAYACSLAVTGGTGPATDTTHWTAIAASVQDVETLDNVYTFHASVQFFRHAAPALDSAGLSPFGLGAFDKATRLATKLSGTRMLELMDTMNMGLEESSPARNVAALVNGGYYEDRGSVDMTFTIPNSETELVNTFATAGISIQVAYPGRPAPDTATITTEGTT